MDGALNILSMWEEEGIIIAAFLIGVVVLHYATKLWSAPIDAVLGLILIASVVLAGCAMYFLHFPTLRFGSRAFWFAALYVWCVLGMMFFAARQTHRMKLFLGLVSQAGILYALFVLL